MSAESDWHTLDELLQLANQSVSEPAEQVTERHVQQTQATENLSKKMQDVHVYDRKLLYQGVEIPPRDQGTKDVLFAKLRMLLRHPHALGMLSMIEKNMYVDDTENKINGSDLLAEILSHKMTFDILNMLEEQLIDNFLLGQCPQGKSTRLMQIWELVRDH